MSLVWFNSSARARMPGVLRILRRLAAHHGLKFVAQAGLNRRRHFSRVQAIIPGATAVFMWGGHRPAHRYVRDIAQHHGVPCIVIEHGWLPQRRYFSIDPHGIIGASSLNGPLDWVTPADLLSLERFRFRYRREYGARVARHEEFTLVPLQLEGDSAIRLYSEWTTMQDFVDFVSSEITGPLIFKTHPRCPNLPLKTDHPVVRSGPIHELFRRCRQVVGINSTSLIEAAMLGCPVVAYGECPIRTHGVNDKLLAAYVSRQVRINGAELPAILSRLGMHLTPVPQVLPATDASTTEPCLGPIA